MTKAYLTQQVTRREQGKENASDFTLDDNPEKAAHWDTKEQADIECILLNGMNVEVASPDGTQHVICKTFAVEDKAPNQFVVFCMLPWSTH